MHTYIICIYIEVSHIKLKLKKKFFNRNTFSIRKRRGNKRSAAISVELVVID